VPADAGRFVRDWLEVFDVASADAEALAEATSNTSSQSRTKRPASAGTSRFFRVVARKNSASA
jgi:UDP-glucose 4-epimerase